MTRLLRLDRAWICAALLLAPAPATGLSEGRDPRSVELVREDCRSSIGRREVTLFGNGTVRVREGEPGDERMRLGESTPEEVKAFLERLAEPDLSETDPSESAPVGDWVEACLLVLSLPGEPPREFRYGRYASHSLALQRVLAVVRDIETRAESNARENSLPLGYEPRAGDLLERTDGIRFEVVAKTADGHGVELSSPDQPLTVYVPLDDLRRLFVKLLRRRNAIP